MLIGYYRTIGRTGKEALLSVLTRPWNFGENINEEDLDGSMEVGGFIKKSMNYKNS